LSDIDIPLCPSGPSANGKQHKLAGLGDEFPAVLISKSKPQVLCKPLIPPTYLLHTYLYIHTSYIHISYIHTSGGDAPISDTFSAGRVTRQCTSDIQQGPLNIWSAKARLSVLIATLPVDNEGPSKSLSHFSNVRLIPSIPLVGRRLK
jgi:hypothetical protein